MPRRPAAVAIALPLCGCATAAVDLVEDGVRAACGESRGERRERKRDGRTFEGRFRDEFRERERAAGNADRRRRAAVPFDPDFTVGPPTT